MTQVIAALMSTLHRLRGRIASLFHHPKHFPVLFLCVFAVTILSLATAEGVVVNRLAVLAAALAAFSTVLILVSNHEAISVSRGLLSEAILQREMKETPHVVVWLEPSSKTEIACDMAVKNVGEAVAYVIKMTWETGEADYSDTTKFDLTFFEQGVNTMVPGREVRRTFGGIQYMKEWPFSVGVSNFPFGDTTGETRICETFILNPWEGAGATVWTRNEGVRAVESIASELRKMNDRPQESDREWRSKRTPSGHPSSRIRGLVQHLLEKS